MPLATNGVETPPVSARPQRPSSNHSNTSELDPEQIDFFAELLPKVPSPKTERAGKKQENKPATTDSDAIPRVTVNGDADIVAAKTQQDDQTDNFDTETSGLNISNGEPPPLQVLNGLPDGLDPIGGDDELDSDNFNLVKPEQRLISDRAKHQLEERSELIFSSRHLEAIFNDSAHLQHFSNFLYCHRRASIPLLVYYLDATKALRAMAYSNSVLQKLQPMSNYDFSYGAQPQPSVNQALEAKAKAAFEELAREELPMYITHVWIQTVTVSIRRKITGTLRHTSEGLAEVFCLTDPSRHDNPIVFMSDEFNRTTQYGVDYVIGRNCRFLQGPHTNPFSVKRIRQRLDAGLEHYETFLNYRRDGSPFMNLVMLAPLYDSRGVIRYFFGAQVDVSGLAKGCYDLPALKRLVDEDAGRETKKPVEDEITQLAEILDPRELEIMGDHGGDMHRPPLKSKGGPNSTTKDDGEAAQESKDEAPVGRGPKSRVVLRESSSRSPITQSQADHVAPSGPSTTAASLAANHNGRLAGVYENYLLVRPYPSLRILFTSPSMAMPGILQTPLLDRIGGSPRMRDQLVQALSQGQGVTARVKWLRKKMSHHRNASTDKSSVESTSGEQEPESESEGRMRWLHCTPLVGSNSKIGVWMVVLVDEDAATSKMNSVKPIINPVTTREKPLRQADTTAILPGHTNGINDGHRDFDGHYTFEKPHMRTRRSSNTLGTPPSLNGPLSENTEESNGKPLPSLPSITSQRPRSPLSNLGGPRRFFNMNALSRTSTVSSFSMSKTAPSLLGTWRKQREVTRSKALSNAEAKKAFQNSSYVPGGDYRLAKGYERK